MTKPLPLHTKRLAQLVHRPGGITATEAVAAAEQRLEGLRDRGLSEISSTLSRMQDLATDIAAGRADRQGSDLYTLSNSLIGVAGVFGKGGLGEIALSLCTLIERLLLVGRWDAQAVQLHLQSMHLAENGVSDLEMKTIGTALRQVVDRVRPLAAQRQVN